MDPARSELGEVFARQGRVVNKNLNVFTIESTINNRMFDKPLEFLGSLKGSDTHMRAQKRSRRGTEKDRARERGEARKNRGK
jgi:lactate racemase